MTQKSSSWEGPVQQEKQEADTKKSASLERKTRARIALMQRLDSPGGQGLQVRSPVLVPSLEM